MLPIRLELHNFLAYRTPPPIQFEGVHLACLTGPNGAGKSSLLDAMTWVLWGKARAKTDDELIHLGQEEMSVSFDFRQHDHLYRVIRTRTRKGRGQGSLTLYGFDPELGAFSSPLGDSVRETQSLINQIIGLDYDTFVHSAFLQQGKADSFTVQTPAKRKEILSEILGLARWETYEEQAKDLLKTNKEELEKSEDRIAELSAEENKIPALNQALAEATHKLEEAQQKREIAETSYQELAGAATELSAVQAQQAALAKQLQTFQKELDRLERDLIKQQKERDKYQRVFDEQEKIEAGFVEYQQTQQLVDELGEKQTQYTDLREQLNDGLRRLDAERTRLEAQISIVDGRIQEAQRTIEAAESLQNKLEQNNIKLAALEQRRSERDDLQRVREELLQEQIELQTTNKSLRAEMNDLKERIEIIQRADGAACPVCGQPLTESHAADLHEQYEVQGKEKGDTFRHNEARLKEITKEVEGHEKTLKKLETELRGVDALKAEEGKIHTQLDQIDQATQRLSVDQAQIEELQQTLESDQYGLDTREEIEALQAQIDALGYDKDAHSETNQALKRLRAFEQQKRDLEQALEKIPELDSQIEELQTRGSELVGEQENTQAESAALAEQITALEAKQKEARRREAELNRQRQAERDATEQVISVQQQIGAIEGARKRRIDLEKRCETLREEIAIYGHLRDAFSKNGIPAMIIEAAIPELETTANQILMQMTDGRMNIRFDTQKESKSTGNVRETLDILISDELGTRSYEMFSGGEGFRVNFALRVALSQFLARRAGARLQTLVIDEGFGSQDDAGRERLIEAINAIQDRFDLILIVTHIEELRDAFPVRVEVRKTANGSTVTIV